MRKAKYTDEDIIAAGKLLHSENKDVSPNAIKIRLGGGNPARIKKVWDERVGNSESSDPSISKLNSPLNPDDEFAFQIDMPVQKAAFKVEAVFEKLIDDLKDPIQQRLEHLLDAETSKLYRAIGGLKSELKHANQQIDHWKAAREEVFQRVMEKSKENERLVVTVDSLTKQIDELKKKQST